MGCCSAKHSYRVMKTPTEHDNYKTQKYAARFATPLDVKKQKSFQLQGGFAPMTP